MVLWQEFKIPARIIKCFPFVKVCKESLGPVFLIIFRLRINLWVLYLLSLLALLPRFLKSLLIWLILLTTLMVNWNSVLRSLFISLLGRLCVIFFRTSSLLLVFTVMERVSYVILFYLLFYGYQLEKVRSGWYLLIFGVISRIVFLWGVLTTNSRVFFFRCFSFKMSLILLVGFMMKLPSFILHLWLPKVHVESSTVGRVVLAALLLKLGCWGLIIFLLGFVPVGGMVFILGLGGVLLSLYCIFLREAKALVAYSSVVHISFFFLVLLWNSKLGLSSSSRLIISHGIVSGLLFYLVGAFYSFLVRREIAYHKGFIKRYLVLGVIIFMVLLINRGLAPTIRFFVELWGIRTLESGNRFILLLLIIYFIFSFFYSLRYALSTFLGIKAPTLQLRGLFPIIFFFIRGGLRLVSLI